jgi:hypothetical protein
MDGSSHKPSHEPANTHRTLFRVIDAVTIGAMVGIGVYCRRAHVSGGRWTGIAASSAVLELSKLARNFIRF